MAILYLTDGSATSDILVYLTILASAASVLTGLVVRVILCCVVGVDHAEDAGSSGEGAADDGSGVTLEDMGDNPAFGM